MKKFMLLLGCAQSLVAGELVFIGRGDAIIHTARLDTNTGALTDLRVAAELPWPSFLAVAPNRRFLYAVSEGPSPEKSWISAFALAPDGALTFLNRQPAAGSAPCHLALDPRGKCLLAANYGSGSMIVFPVQRDGSLGTNSALIQNHGTGANPERQAGPHAHCALTDPAGRYAFDCDLGLDQILVYKLDAAAGTLTPNDPPFFAGKAGAGPRHLAFHPNGRLAFLVNELDSTLVSLNYDAGKGALSAADAVSLLPADFAGRSSAAEVAVHPSGKWVYGSNRGHDSIAVFACEASTGKLTFVERHSSGGKTPRNFEIDPTGAFLLAANQDSDAVVVFRIDPASGRLAETGHSAHVPKPMCVKCLADE